MPSDPRPHGGSPLDEGLLSPVTAGHDDTVADAAVLDALVAAEVALVRAYARIGMLDAELAERTARSLTDADLDVAELAAASVAGGNPVIPLVSRLARVAPADAAIWVHRGATSQDILDTAIMILAARALDAVSADVERATDALEQLAREHRDRVAPARTLTQHGVPTTLGARFSTWLRGLRRAASAVARVRAELPAQLGGAGGTLASFREITGSGEATLRLVAAFAAHTRLAAPDAPWHTTRWPVTELGDALVQLVDAFGMIASDVATASRTEIGELGEGTAGGSSAMPQKQNPAASVLLRSAAMRAPQLGATLHLAAALAVDERPDGAWHAEWPTLRELLRLALGAAATGATLLAGLRVDGDAVSRSLAMTGDLLVAERLAVVLGPRIGKDAVTALVRRAASGESLAQMLAGVPEASDLDLDDLLDPAAYTGLAGHLVDTALVDTALAGSRSRPAPTFPEHPA